METQELVTVINNEMGLGLSMHMTLDEIRQCMQAFVSYLIEKEFQQLVNVLYQIDVNERKLKYLLQENVGEDAAVIIADLIIARQLEKIDSRKAYGLDNGLPSDEEKW